MADNLTQIFDTIGNLNTTIEFNTSEILVNAINYSNSQSDNWLGIFIFLMCSLALFILVNKYKNDFKLNTDLMLGLFTLNVLIDVGFLLYQFRILANLQLVIVVYTIFTSMCVFSIIKKDGEAVSS